MGTKQEYYIKNKDRIDAKNKEWYQKNKEYVLAKRAEWRKENLHIDKERKREYASKNRQRVSAHNREWISKQKSDVRTKLGNKCIRCGFSDERVLQVHHKTPKTKTGRLDYITKDYDLSLVELLCANCHAIEHYNFYKNNHIKT
jgi:hypothetical protein